MGKEAEARAMVEAEAQAKAAADSEEEGAAAPVAVAFMDFLPHFIAQAEAEKGKAASEALDVAEELRRCYTAAPASAKVAFPWPWPRKLNSTEGGAEGGAEGGTL